MTSQAGLPTRTPPTITTITSTSGPRPGRAKGTARWAPRLWTTSQAWRTA